VVATLLLMALTPAICEEALFRGPILRGLASRFSPLGAAVLTGLLFGLYHVDVWRLVPTAVLGVILSLIALHSGSIIPSMLAHFINNGCLIVLAHRGVDDALTKLKLPTQIGLLALASLILALGAVLVRRSNSTAARDIAV
jgi:membrane protease YdiL (CAAX protease family)